MPPAGPGPTITKTKRRVRRLVIAMPTRFTSNALAINVAESLSDTGLYHSSAWFVKFENDVKKNNILRKKTAITLKLLMIQMLSQAQQIQRQQQPMLTMHRKLGSHPQQPVT